MTRPALVLVDLQTDYLAAPGMEPGSARLVERTAALLGEARRRGLPVAHVWTTVRREDDRRMPHWKQAGLWRCEAGTPGHAPPESLRPASGELVVEKVFYSGFENGALERALRSAGADTVVLAGVHLHACVRATALDAYARGFAVRIVEDATASDDPLQAAAARRYLEARAARFVSVDGFSAEAVAGENGEGGAGEAAAALAAWGRWSESAEAERGVRLRRFAALLERDGEALARTIAGTIGKPVRQARGEVERARALVEAVFRRQGEPSTVPCGGGAVARRVPLGVVAVVTPWNNPLAIPVGKIAPAVFYGNTVVWKPAPAGAEVARQVAGLFDEAGLGDGVVVLVEGGPPGARRLMEDPAVSAVTFSGSSLAGWSVQEICARRRIPLQAELGGNNAAVVWLDADLEEAASGVAEGAFAFAGQRCTANRRVVVAAECHAEFVGMLRVATARLVWGEPFDARTEVGPLVSEGARARVAALVDRARPQADQVFVPHGIEPPGPGPYYPPTILCCSDPRAEIVQEESFGPILVVQPANTWEEAIGLCNGVRQGLAAALFTRSEALQERFLREARAGILKIGRSTADAGTEAPFGGWKSSGLGPPEHGPGNPEFYTRWQAVYG